MPKRVDGFACEECDALFPTMEDCADHEANCKNLFAMLKPDTLLWVDSTCPESFKEDVPSNGPFIVSETDPDDILCRLVSHEIDMDDAKCLREYHHGKENKENAHFDVSITLNYCAIVLDERYEGFSGVFTISDSVENVYGFLTAFNSNAGDSVDIGDTAVNIHVICQKGELEVVSEWKTYLRRLRMLGKLLVAKGHLTERKLPPEHICLKAE